METRFRPMGDNVLIQPDSAETKGGIIQPWQKPPNTGTVLAISPDHPFEVTVGDRIHYQPSGKQELEDGTVVISESNILFIY